MLPITEFLLKKKDKTTVKGVENGRRSVVMSFGRRDYEKKGTRPRWACSSGWRYLYFINFVPPPRGGATEERFLTRKAAQLLERNSHLGSFISAVDPFTKGIRAIACFSKQGLQEGLFSVVAAFVGGQEQVFGGLLQNGQLTLPLEYISSLAVDPGFHIHYVLCNML